MKIFATVRINSKISKIEDISDKHYKIYIKESPKEGAANTAIINALAKHFRIAKSRVKLVTGHKSKQKVFEII